MFFIISIIAFVWLGIHKGLFFMISILFNLSVAIYIAIASVPGILHFSPGLSGSTYYAVGCLVVIVVSVFAGLHWLSLRFFQGDKAMYFGTLFDSAASAVVGFLTGYIFWGFLMLLFTILPLSQKAFVQKYVSGKNAREFAHITMTDVCKFVIMTSLDSPGTPIEEKVQALLDLQTAPDSIEATN